MAYEIIDHGDWTVYEPDNRPAGAPANALFSRRADGQDWYEFRAANLMNSPGSVFATALPTARGFYMSAIVRDPTLLNALNIRVLEIRGVDPSEDKPHKLFEQKRYDPQAKTIAPFPALPVPLQTNKADIWRRATDAEAAKIAAGLDALPLRKRRIYDDATYLDHSDPLFDELVTGFIQAFGEARTSELLAASE